MVKTAKDAHDYLGRYALQVSVIAEGNEKEFLGWITPQSKQIFDYPYRYWVTSVRNYSTSLLLKIGGERAMVPIGSYERVMPLDYFYRTFIIT